VVYRKENGMKTEKERRTQGCWMAGSIHHGEDRKYTNITYRLRDLLRINLAALCEATHRLTLRATRKTTPRRVTSSMLRPSSVVEVQPDQRGTLRNIGCWRWCRVMAIAGIVDIWRCRDMSMGVELGVYDDVVARR
jgi:hypothetical protein